MEQELTLDDIVQKLVDDEMQKYFDKLNELEKRIEALEQESRELNKHIERVEQTQRSVTEVVIRV